MSRQRRYPSDLTDEQWALVEPLLPAPRTGGRLVKQWEQAKVTDLEERPVSVGALTKDSFT